MEVRINAYRVVVRSVKEGDHLSRHRWEDNINPLNAELSPICHLLALLGAHHILHVSRMRVKMDVEEVNGRLWTGMIWLRVERSGILL